MKKLIPFLLATTLISGLAACNSYGKKYDYNKNQNVYYKGDGLDEAAAKKLADYLGRIQYFGGDKELSVQLVKTPETKDTVTINFVVDKTRVTPVIEKEFIKIGGYISTAVYGKGPVKVGLVDTEMKEVSKLGYAAPLNEDDTPAGDHNKEGGVQ